MTLAALDIDVRYDTRVAVRAANVTIAPGELVALVDEGAPPGRARSLFAPLEMQEDAANQIEIPLHRQSVAPSPR